MKVAVTGSHGLIGGALVRRLGAEGHQVTRVIRGIPRGPDEMGWDPVEGTVDAGRLEGHDAVVHLAGPGIGDHRWTDKYKSELRRSRVDGTALLAKALAALDRPPKVLASASAIGFYGDRGDEVLTEADGPGTGFLAELVQQWEQATAAAAGAGVRVALLRSGIVQSARGGALRRQLPPFKLGLGGRIGTGRQWWSWIAIDDEVGAIVHVLGDESLAGPVNLTAPEPVTNAEFTVALGRALQRPTPMPTPTAALRLLLGRELVEEMLLGGQRVLPRALQEAGYTFRYTRLDDALAAVLGEGRPTS